ncbi:MAG TPA: hypothetical protein VFE16_08815 [Candidatus Cybelea sp.]|jgi:hypothetical protein|nr:hypothetical protein [Candidatus Cybelea sp.]
MSPEIDAYNKLMIIQLMSRATRPMRGGEPDMHAALMLMTTAVDKLLTLIYVRLCEEQLINPLPGEPTLQQRCEIVAETLAAIGVETQAVDVPTLRELMPILGRVKHSIRPRVERPVEMFSIAQFVVNDLYEYYFGERFWFDDDEDPDPEPTLRELPYDRFEELKRERIRHYIAPHLSPDELGIFDVVPDQFIAGIVDSATLRRATGWSNWLDFGAIPTMELWAKMLPATYGDAELIFCEKAVQVVSDLRAFVRTEAWSYRARLNIPSDQRSDIELCLSALRERIEAWPDEGEEAA